MEIDPSFVLLAVTAVTLVGLAKGGLSGVGMFGMPLLTLAVGPGAAAGILLPILIVQDAVSVWAFRRTWDGRVLAIMLPGAIAGIALGWLFAARVSVDAVMAIVGVITLVFALQRLWAGRNGQADGPVAPYWTGALYGLFTGFTSHIAHAGGPPFQMFAMQRGLPRDVFVGTGAIFFAVVNWLKVPPYIALGQFTRETLLTTAALMPVAILSTLAGVWVVRRIDGPRFYTIIYLLMIPVALKLIWDAAT